MQAAKNALAPKVAEVRAVEGPVQALAHAVTTVASEYGSELGLGPSAQPPALGPRPAALRNIIITGENDNTVEAEAEAQAEAPEGPPEVGGHSCPARKQLLRLLIVFPRYLPSPYLLCTRAAGKPPLPHRCLRRLCHCLAVAATERLRKPLT